MPFCFLKDVRPQRLYAFAAYLIESVGIGPTRWTVPRSILL